MTRDLRRLLITPGRLSAGSCAAGELALECQELHYLTRVLRLRPGDRFAVVDGAGRLWSALLGPADLAELEQAFSSPLAFEPPAPQPLQLALALPKRDADVVLRMACELGIDLFIPLQAERSVAADPLKPQRAQAILREALEQCERLWQPQLDSLRPASELLGAGPPGGSCRGLLCTTRRPGMPLLAQALERLGGPPGAGASEPLTVAIGPEGGWTPGEEALALAHGWQAVSLGSTILRCSTAAVTAAGLLSHWRALQTGGPS
ncbi:16S rRNA (uracil(1498)-N(3))-methyltransferase [Synechococcus sp. CS-1330]|nr:16S rRNA (uracil(1498)-N(3))-methyltransferase [Synechococcus sp. CS-1330]